MHGWARNQVINRGINRRKKRINRWIHLQISSKQSTHVKDTEGQSEVTSAAQLSSLEARRVFFLPPPLLKVMKYEETWGCCGWEGRKERQTFSAAQYRNLLGPKRTCIHKRYPGPLHIFDMFPRGDSELESQVDKTRWCHRHEWKTEEKEGENQI